MPKGYHIPQCSEKDHLLIEEWAKSRTMVLAIFSPVSSHCNPLLPPPDLRSGSKRKNPSPMCSCQIVSSGKTTDISR